MKLITLTLLATTLMGCSFMPVSVKTHTDKMASVASELCGERIHSTGIEIEARETANTSSFNIKC